MSDDPSPALTYSKYLALDELLGAQRLMSADSPDGPEHDELLFIIVHQTYELWFKQLLHELDLAKSRMTRGQINRALHTLKRIRTIFKVIVGQIDILETMTPLEFSSFRDRLDESSGLQSMQFREVECSLGLKDPSVLSRYDDDPERRERIAERIAQPSLWDASSRSSSSRATTCPRARGRTTRLLPREPARICRPSLPRSIATTTS